MPNTDSYAFPYIVTLSFRYIVSGVRDEAEAVKWAQHLQQNSPDNADFDFYTVERRTDESLLEIRRLKDALRAIAQAAPGVENSTLRALAHDTLEVDNDA